MSTGDDNIYGLIAEDQQAVGTDLQQLQLRASKLRHLFVDIAQTAAERQALEGRSFVASSPTPGTGIADTIVTAFDATIGLYEIFNNGVDDVILDFIKLLCTVAPASATAMHLTNFLDFVGVARKASGGSVLVPKNVNGNTTGRGAETSADVVVNVGALVFNAATTAQRRHSRMIPRSVIPVVKDEIIMVFGKDAWAGADDEGGTVAKRVIVPAPPVIIGPGATFIGNPFYPSVAVTPASWEVDIGFHKRKH